MGVKGLWSVLEPSSQPVRLEALSGQRIAIDASIWLNQFVKALHDKDGNPLDQAHIIGFYRRICKLLYFGVKPVFVFDGNAPELKRKVIAERRRRGQDRSRNIRRDANRLLALQLQKQALDNAQPGATSPSPHQQKRKGGSGITKPRDLKRKKDEFELSSFDGPEESRFIAKAADDERLPLREEIREFVSNQAHEFSHDVEFDIEDPDFLALPQDIQTELLRALKNQSRRTSYERLQHMLETSRDAYDFSQQQIQNLVRRNDLMQKYFVVSGAHSRVTDPKYLKSNNNLEFSRVAAERDTHYMLVKDEERGAGWVFSRTNNQEQPAEDDTIPSITSNGLKGMNNEGQDQGQHDDDDNDDDDSDVWAQGSQTPAQTGSYDGNYVTISSASSDSFDTDIIIPDNPDNPCEPSIIGANDDKYFPEDAYRPQPPPVPPSTIQQDAWYLQQQHYYYQQQQQYHHQPQSRPQAQSRPQQAFQESHVTNQDLNSMLSSLSADEFLTAMIQMVPQQIIRLVPGIIDQMEAMMDPEDICEEDLEEMHSRFQRRLEKRPEADFPALIEQATDLIRLINVSNGQRRSDMDALADLGSESGGDDSDNYEKADRKAGSTVNAAADAAEKSNAIYADKTFKRSLETAHMEIMVAFMGYLIEWRLRHPRTSSSDAGSKGRGRNKSLLFLSAVSPNIDQIDGYRRGDKGLAARETPDGSSEGPSAKTEVPLPQDAAIPVSILRAKSSPPADEGGDNAVELAGPGIHDDIEVVANTELIYDKVCQAKQKLRSTAVQLTPDTLPCEAAADGTAPNGQRPCDTVPEDAKPMLDSDDEEFLDFPGYHRDTDMRQPSEVDAGETVDISSDEEENIDVEAELDGYANVLSRLHSDGPDNGEPQQEKPQVSNRIIDLTTSKNDTVGPTTMDTAERTRPALASLSIARRQVENEITQLRGSVSKTRLHSSTVTDAMVNDVRTLLRIFGIPYFTAPAEAEAQCAYLLQNDLVDAVISEDSDVLLFGATKLYRNVFQKNKFAELYTKRGIADELNLSRWDLICMAYLLGSDYTTGVSGIGPALALSIVKEWGCKDNNDGSIQSILRPLTEFKAWWDGVVAGSASESLEESKLRKRLRKLAAKTELSKDFPNPHIAEAYINPSVDDTNTRGAEMDFQWGIPDHELIAAFLSETLGWSSEQIDSNLIPLVKKVIANLYGPSSG